MYYEEIFKLHMSDTGNTTYGEMICAWLNKSINDRNKEATRHLMCDSTFMFVYGLPDHEITPKELHKYIAFDHCQFGSVGLFDKRPMSLP